MFSRIEVDQVRRIADLARQAADAHRRLVGGLRDIELGEQPDERGDRNPSDLDSLSLLGQTAERREFDALRDAIAELSPEQRQELKAATLIGRGEFAAGQWDEAMSAAAAIPASSDVDYVSERLNLHDELTKALFEMGCQ